jgi:hypothetical protein
MVAGKGGWADKSTADLVRELVRSGLDIDRGLVEELLKRGAAVVPHLAEILDQDRYWSSDEKTPGRGWAPISALHLLGAIADPSGLDAILRVLHHRPDDLGDWLTEDIPSILACFGAEAIEPLKELVSSRDLDVFVRVAGSIALSLIVRIHPGCREEVINFLHEVLVREGEDIEFLSLCVGDLAELRDPRSKPIIRSLFDKRMINNETITWHDVEEIYRSSGEDLPQHNKEDPMTFFSPEKLNYLKKISEQVELEDETQTTASWSEREELKKKVSRNDPCPCGSGKKYKKCCLPRTRSRRKVDEDEKNLRDAILKFAATERFRPNWEHALDMYVGDSENTELEDTAEETMFMDWVIHDYPCAWSREPIVTIFAKEKASTLNERQRRILIEWQNTLFGAYEVIEILVGKGIRLRDIITEEEYFVEDVSVSNAAALWDIIVTRVIGVDGIFHVSGAATILPQNRKRDLKYFIETGYATYKKLHRGASFREFLRAESQAIIQYASPERTPIVTTTEGDEFYLARALYGLRDRKATKRILDGIQELQSTGKNNAGAYVYNWLEAERSIDRRDRRHRKGGFEEHRILGVVTLTHDSLELECFSKERLTRLQELLERKLKSSITFLADLGIDVETALKRLKDKPGKKIPSLPKDEERKVIEEYLNQYYLEKWINMKIPALQNKTPLQAMKTEEGKAALAELLNELQNNEERKRKDGEHHFDVNKLRRKLGLPNPRNTIDEQKT